MRPSVINITFHGVGEPTRRLEPGEEDVWLSTAQFVSALDAISDRGDARISFDDGNVSDVTDALPVLRARGLSATFFVVAGRLGAPGFLNDRDIGILVDAGMKIGCHGMRHRPWRRLGDQELREELLISRRRLEELVGAPVAQAACPYGAYDRRVLSSLRRYGYDRVFTSDGGTTRPGQWVQARNTLRRRDGSDAVDRIVAGDVPLAGAVRRGVKQAVKRWR